MDLNIRDFPDDLYASLRKRAAASGETLKGLAVRVLSACLTQKSDGVLDESYVVTCPMCGQNGPLVRFGANAKCFHCGIGFMPPEGL